MSFHVILVGGARPNFIKVSALSKALARHKAVRVTLVHTGQHYGPAMSASFFEQLDIPDPDFHLEVGSGTHAVQTAEVMTRFEPLAERLRPDAVVVVGDVNSTIACALVAAKLGIAVVHVEAGLRSFDRGMPEEINRIVTDHLSDRLYVTEREAIANLLREGMQAEQIMLAGNVMIDTLRGNLERAVPADTLLAEYPDFAAASAQAGGYGVLTLHRPSNVDSEQEFTTILRCLSDLSLDLPLIFPAHPRTRARLETSAARAIVEKGRFLLLPPVGYLEMLGLMSAARVVLTDSGGIQEETTVLGVPCVTLRHNTERPVTVEEGTNIIAGTDPDRIRAAVLQSLHGSRAPRVPAYWDGHAGERIADDLLRWLGTRPRSATG